VSASVRVSAFSPACAPSIRANRQEIDSTTNFDVRGTPYAYTTQNPGTWSSSQPDYGSVIQNAVSVSTNGPSISAVFTPNYGFTIAQAAAICGISNFDWQQTITHLPDPSPYYDASGNHLTSASAPFNHASPFSLIRIGFTLSPFETKRRGRTRLYVDVCRCSH